jgi:hypothetical protein
VAPFAEAMGACDADGCFKDMRAVVRNYSGMPLGYWHERFDGILLYYSSLKALLTTEP